jgi:hypothetical protein
VISSAHLARINQYHNLKKDSLSGQVFVYLSSRSTTSTVYSPVLVFVSLVCAQLSQDASSPLLSSSLSLSLSLPEEGLRRSEPPSRRTSPLVALTRTLLLSLDPLSLSFPGLTQAIQQRYTFTMCYDYLQISVVAGLHY